MPRKSEASTARNLELQRLRDQRLQEDPVRLAERNAKRRARRRAIAADKRNQMETMTVATPKRNQMEAMTVATPKLKTISTDARTP